MENIGQLWVSAAETFTPVSAVPPLLVTICVNL